MNEDIVPYGDHPLQQLKFYQYDEANYETILLLHGGAWRDPNNTYNDFQDMVNHIRKNPRSSKCNLIAMNYRLSPEVKHPYHLWDVLEGLQFLVQNYNIDEILIAGHSVGATLMLQLLNYNEILDIGFEILHDDLRVNGLVTEKVLNSPLGKQRTALNKALTTLELKTLYFIDGIYDIVKLISEYGTPYESFVNNAFTSDKQYTEATQLSCTRKYYRNLFTFDMNHGEDLNEVNIVIIQSVQDELLSMNQTRLFIEYLTKEKKKFTSLTGEWGGHENVFRNEEIANIIVDNL